MQKKKTKKDGSCPECGNMREADWEKCVDKFGDNMESWGENFGKHMEAKFSGHPPWGKRKRGLDIGALFFGLFVLAWGVVELGKAMGWWQINFPFWPAIIILVGLAILFSIIKKAF